MSCGAWRDFIVGSLISWSYFIFSLVRPLKRRVPKAARAQAQHRVESDPVFSVTAACRSSAAAVVSSSTAAARQMQNSSD